MTICRERWPPAGDSRAEQLVHGGGGRAVEVAADEERGRRVAVQHGLDPGQQVACLCQFHVACGTIRA